jgi:hypothetical protein
MGCPISSTNLHNVNAQVRANCLKSDKSGASSASAAAEMYLPLYTAIISEDACFLLSSSRLVVLCQIHCLPPSCCLPAQHTPGVTNPGCGQRLALQQVTNRCFQRSSATQDSAGSTGHQSIACTCLNAYLEVADNSCGTTELAIYA